LDVLVPSIFYPLQEYVARREIVLVARVVEELAVTLAASAAVVQADQADQAVVAVDGPLISGAEKPSTYHLSCRPL